MIRTSAKSLAERAGAAQYAVHIEEELSPEEISSPHDLRKRLSNENLFEDTDYEIYQGVVGRPGVGNYSLKLTKHQKMNKFHYQI